MNPLGHLAIREFGDDDRAIDQHADRHDRAEEHDHVDADAAQVQEEERRTERTRYRDADQQAILDAENADQDDEHEHDRRDDVVEQAGDVLLDPV